MSNSNSFLIGDRNCYFYFPKIMLSLEVIWEIFVERTIQAKDNLQTVLETVGDKTILSLFNEVSVWEFCPQEDACEIPVPKWIDQGDALFLHLKNLLNF